MSTATDISIQKTWALLEQVNDPEVPVLSITDLGIVRDVKLNGDEVEVVITPTYSGCPAMMMIEWEIKAQLVMRGGFSKEKVKVTTVLSPAWTTDWMSEAGKEKLKAYGIAPPLPTASVCDINLFAREEAIQCPRCNSYHTVLVSQFGSTACKAHYRCEDCKEPFDYFKCH
ncbi:MAG TPA: 1,2-phenylacetyl-CoA epoxidase subunit PaaD [Chitinophagaceae bacterium]|jgi:ring-1,2-phenylacetyl-CoA epoxidase subunit PaaD